MIILREMFEVLFIIGSGFFSDVKTNLGRYLFSLFAVGCIINTVVPVGGLPLAVEGLSIVAIIVSVWWAVLFPVWKLQSTQEEGV